MKKRLIIPLFLLVTLFAFGQDTTQIIIPGRVNSVEQQRKPYVILISADGFRSDFSTKYSATFLKSKEADGVKAEAMIPSYPTLTFPNHYSIVTGLYPSHHGLVDNAYFDPSTGQEYRMANKKMVADGRWYGGTPLWILAEKQAMISACFYWVASEADIQGIRPTYFYPYNENIPIDQRIQAVKNWLRLPVEKRPHLITFYFPQVDHDAHEFGPEDPRVLNSVQFVDASIKKLTEALEELNLPINYVFVSDHGMTTVDPEHPLGKPNYLPENDFVVPGGDALLHVYAKDSAKIEEVYVQLKKEAKFDTYRINETPAHWHYRKSDDRFNRLGDLLLVPKYPSVFNLSPRKTSPGKHGFDNHMPDMQASFQAWGPGFKKDIKIKAFENVHVYPLIAQMLGLRYSEKTIDGNLKMWRNVLKN